MLTTTTPISTNQTTIPATNLIKNTMTSDTTASKQNTKLKIQQSYKKNCELTKNNVLQNTKIQKLYH